MQKSKFKASQKIQQALETLKEASEEGREGVHQALEGLYETVQQAKKEARNRALQKASDLDQQVRANPWAYLGGAAIGGFILGLFLRRRSRH